MKDRVSDPTAPEITTQQCVGESAVSKSSRASTKRNGCSGYDIRKTTDGYVVDAACVDGNLTTAWHSEIAGDLNSHYVVTSTTRNQHGPSAPPVERTTVTSAKWLGDCQPDQKPGDLIVPGGPKMPVGEAEGMGVIPKGPPF